MSAGNPTERPEDKTPFQQVTDELTGGCGCACHTGTGYNTACSHCRPTERPEERDSLAEIEARLEKAVPFRKPADDDPADVLFLWTLVASDPERPFHTCEESENYGDCEHPEALAESELIAHAQADLRTLINEVKDAHKALDEANDTMFADLGRITQMEEALRGVLPLVVVRNGQGDRAVLRAAQLLALSPSDTEEEA